jgi:hypothetical protein
MIKSKQLRAGKLPKEQYELAKKKEAEIGRAHV